MVKLVEIIKEMSSAGGTSAGSIATSPVALPAKKKKKKLIKR